mmetsp:Transcript_12024/g.21871  ORF Transcript_12024/g.21871 Transcript_12024/m.21871 type:complete len:308 (-) Transcript_12024:449-1372(-)|eukprot:CAMPEP_0202491824 /NCGR_PEP_ID=MMETSP1361-20130828/8765_1 /ASSEMBLY_ACC=CAM_ASM_000849 /TAXON_ID=210615 /ORGANISM="Staurosira complex sp., Strain CCMP2646" /LENGTH=307 /DNA_ID=CAMNT_0049121939 /DNA_START=119 /DNA_END=1042 /DNA_ORIENTATION=-
MAARALFSTAANDQQEVPSMRASEIKKELESYGINTKTFLEKSELVDALTKARAEGLTSIKEETTRSGTTSSSESTTESTTTSSAASSASRDERLKEELEKCKAMKASELKQELQALGVSTKSFFEKSEFAKALAEARVDGVKKRATSTSSNEEGYAEYADVEVLTDDSAGPRKKSSQQQPQQQGSPFGDVKPGANPFGSMGGMGGMGGIADMLKNFGGAGGAMGSNPFAGGAGGAGNPFGSGMGDMMGKAQDMMKNPKVMEIIGKAQSNPKIMKAVQECMSNPAAMAKYKNDPEVAELLNELKKYL